MSKLEKLMKQVLSENPNLRFADVCKVFEIMGYERRQPSGGSSHYVFRKKGCLPVTIPKKEYVARPYAKLVSEAVQRYIQEEQNK